MKKLNLVHLRVPEGCYLTHLGGYEGAVSGSYGIGAGLTTGMGFNVDTLLLANGEIFPGVFFGHQGFHGDYMCSYVSFVGKSSIRGIEIKMGAVSRSDVSPFRSRDPHFHVRHNPDDTENESNQFNFQVSGSANNTTIIGASVVAADKISVKTSAAARNRMQ